jgi:ubiquinone biosynthesis accessory factor UbiJ
VIPAGITAAFETAVNALLRFDPETRARLAALNGSVIAIEPRELEMTFYLWPSADGIRVTEAYDGEPTVRIRGALLVLIRQGLGQPAAAGDITVEGNTALGWEFQTALARLTIDWEERLATLIGDPAAHQLGHFWRGFQRWGQHSGDALLHNSAEYLQHEASVLPPRPMVEQFLSAVDLLREDADRLTARIERLRQRLTASQ